MSSTKMGLILIHLSRKLKVLNESGLVLTIIFDLITFGQQQDRKLLLHHSVVSPNNRERVKVDILLIC